MTFLRLARPPGARREEPGTRRRRRPSGRSVGEVAGAGEVHGDAGGLGGVDDLLVTDGATRLDDGADPGVDEDLEAVGEGEEGVGGGHGPAGALWCGRSCQDIGGVGPTHSPLLLLGAVECGVAGEAGPQGVGPLDGQLAGVDAVDLPHAHTDGGTVMSQEDRVGAHGTHRAPGEDQIGQERVVGGRARGQGPGRGVVAGGVQDVTLLDDGTSRDLLDLVALALGGLDEEQAQVLLGGQDLHGLVVEGGGGDDLSEDRLDLTGHLGGDDRVGGDDAAVG